MHSGEIPRRRQGFLGRVQAQLGKRAVKQEVEIQNFRAGLDFFGDDPQALVTHIAIQQARIAKQEAATPASRFRRSRKERRQEIPAPEEAGETHESDPGKGQPVDVGERRAAEQPPRKRVRANHIGPIVFIGVTIVGGAIIQHLGSTYAKEGGSATPTSTPPPTLAIANPAQRRDIEALANDCIGNGNPQLLHITLPKSEAPSFEAIVGAVEETGKVTGGCPMPQFSALLAEDNAYQSPGLVPEPDFNPNKIEHDAKGAFEIAAPQSAHWK